MNVYVWNEGWREDYSSGVVAVVANTVDEARQLAAAKLNPPPSDPDDYDGDSVSRQSLLNEPKIYPVDVPGVVVDEYGGA